MADGGTAPQVAEPPAQPPAQPTVPQPIHRDSDEQWYHDLMRDVFHHQMKRRFSTRGEVNFVLTTALALAGAAIPLWQGDVLGTSVASKAACAACFLCWLISIYGGGSVALVMARPEGPTPLEVWDFKNETQAWAAHTPEITNWIQEYCVQMTARYARLSTDLMDYNIAVEMRLAMSKCLLAGAGLLMVIAMALN